MVKYLLLNNFNINALNFYGDSPLHLAVDKKNIEIIKYLAIFGANMSQYGSLEDTPLMRAANEKYYDGVKILLQYGAPLTADFVSYIKEVNNYDPPFCNDIIKLIDIAWLADITYKVGFISKEMLQIAGLFPSIFFLRMEYNFKHFGAKMQVNEELLSSIKLLYSDFLEKNQDDILYDNTSCIIGGDIGSILDSQ